MGIPVASDTAMAHDTAAFCAAFCQPSAAMEGPAIAQEAGLLEERRSEVMRGLPEMTLPCAMIDGGEAEKASAVVAPAKRARPQRDARVIPKISIACVSKNRC